MNILGNPSATMEQCKAWLSKIKTAHPLAEAMLPLLWDAAMANGVDPVVLIAQAMKETGYFNFKGVIRPNYCNTCGLKVTKGGGDQDPGAHMRFEYWEDGIMAHSDHLALYAGAPNMPKYSPDCASHSNEQYKNNGTTKDPRHFTYLLGKCPTVESLGGNWAPSSSYGDSIVEMVNAIKNTVVEDDEAELRMEIQLLEDEIDLLDVKLFDLEEDNQLLEEKVDYYSSENMMLLNQNKALCDDNQSLMTSIGELLTENEQVINQNVALNAEVNLLRTENEELKKYNEGLRDKANGLQEVFDALKNAIKAILE